MLTREDRHQAKDDPQPSTEYPGPGCATRRDRLL